MRRAVAWALAILLALAVGVGALWPIPAPERPLTRSDLHDLPRLLLDATVASAGDVSRIYEIAARPGPEADRTVYHIEWLLRTLRYRLLYSRDQVAAHVADTDYYGRRAIGASAAAEAYFCKPLADLDAAQLVTLAALTAHPSGANDLEWLTDRRNRILDRLGLAHTDAPVTFCDA